MLTQASALLVRPLIPGMRVAAPNGAGSVHGGWTAQLMMSFSTKQRSPPRTTARTSSGCRTVRASRERAHAVRVVHFPKGVFAQSVAFN